MQLQSLKSQVAGVKDTANVKIRMFSSRLEAHGEVQVRMEDGSEFSMHLGDMGLIEDTNILFQDREGQIWVLMADSIAQIYTHLGYKES